MSIRIGIILCPVDIFFEDRVGFYGLEFRLEAIKTMTVGAAVGTAAGIGEFVAIVLGLISWCSPGKRLLKGQNLEGGQCLLHTNCPSLHLPSSPSWDQRQCDRSWRRNEEDAGTRRQCRQQGQRDHGRFACESESLPR